MKRINAINVETTNMSGKLEAETIVASGMVLNFYASNFFYDKLMSTNLLALRGESQNSVTKRMSNDELYDLFMSGAEEWNGIRDFELDLKVDRYYSWYSKVVGWIMPMKPTLHVNGKYFDNATEEDKGNNIAHEWSHMLGIRHSGTWFKESLPYLINKWFREYYSGTHNTDPAPIPVPTVKYITECYRTWRRLWLWETCFRRAVVS